VQHLALELLSIAVPRNYIQPTILMPKAQLKIAETLKSHLTPSSTENPANNMLSQKEKPHSNNPASR
jgi:hypothetical protein